MTKALPVKTLVKNGKPVLSFSEVMALSSGDRDTFVTAYMTYLENLSDSGRVLFEEIHNNCIFAMQNAKDNSNSFALMTAVYKAVKNMKGARHNTLKTWFMTYAPVIMESDVFKFDDSKGNDHWNIETATLHPYYEKAELEEKPAFNLNAFLAMCERMVKQADGKNVDPSQATIIKGMAQLVQDQVIPKVKEAIDATTPKDATQEESAPNVSLTEAIAA